jgi:wyosine [tRNA(Phe)-imidazoG37] synthetase (radical SAM superfamily)
MELKKFKYVYGPVASWRLGNSLGIDPVFKGRKVCNFDCVYCQIGRTGFLADQRYLLVSSDEVIKELKFFSEVRDIDYITFSGAGEPTLAANLGSMIKAVRMIRREKIAVITNSSLINDEEVRKDLSLADFVLAKVDAPDQKVFEQINRPLKTIHFNDIILGLKSFRKICKGRLALQMMFTDENKGMASEMSRIAKEINPHEVQINTPLRPSSVKPLSESDMAKIERHFEGLNVVSVYNVEKRRAVPVSDPETLKRRGKI